ncbi:MAG: hypothetical protein JRJ57_11635 [Deltaproteobacteria bacterium]|nr:hypothetical protein [Deltaproteobacteria bacterium]
MLRTDAREIDVKRECLYIKSLPGAEEVFFSELISMMIFAINGERPDMNDRLPDIFDKLMPNAIGYLNSRVEDFKVGHLRLTAGLRSMVMDSRMKLSGPDQRTLLECVNSYIEHNCQFSIKTTAEVREVVRHMSQKYQFDGEIFNHKPARSN